MCPSVSVSLPYGKEIKEEGTVGTEEELEGVHGHGGGHSELSDGQGAAAA